MKLSDIVVRLASQLPKHTDKFHTSFAYESVVLGTSGLVTITTKDPHGLETGAYVIITNISVKRRIVEYWHREPGKALIAVDTDHDLTEGWQSTVKITGAFDDVFNGDLKLLKVPNRRSFLVEVSPKAPEYALGEEMYFHEKLEIGLDGAYEVTKINDKTFTITIDSDLPIDFGDFEGTIIKGQRVIGSISLERFDQLYTKNGANEYWAVVVFDDAQTSKDRSVMSDAISTGATQGDLRAILLRGFSVYVFAPVKNQLAGVDAADALNSEVVSALYKALWGWLPPSGFSEKSNVGIQPTSYGIVSDNNAYVIYQYRFEAMIEINGNDGTGYDGNTDTPTRAFRDVVLNFMNEFENIAMSKNIDLDDEPLRPN